MQYLDLNSRSYKRRLRKSYTMYVLASLVVILALVYFLPVLNVFKKILQSPTVLSFIKDPKQEIASTDGKTNFLLLGIDKRSNVPYSYTLGNKEVRHNGFLSDTIIIASIDFKAKTVNMLSLPRDLWVKVPGWDGNKSQYAKVNSAYSIGASFNYPGGGEALAKDTVSQNFGIPIHYVVRTDFEGFRKAVDTVGGINIDVENSFDDYMYPREGYEDAYPYESRFLHISFKSGSQKMDGETALQYVRSRQGNSGEGNDFARARRQQKALVALREKVLSVGTLADPNKIAGLYDTFGESIYSDIPLGGYTKLYSFAKEIDPTIIKSQVLESDGDDPVLVHPPLEDYGGAWVLIPKNNDWNIVSHYVKVFFGIISPTPSATPANKVVTPRN